MHEPMIICSAKNGSRWSVQLLHIPHAEGHWSYEVREAHRIHGEKVTPFDFKQAALYEFFTAANGQISKSHQAGELPEKLTMKMIRSLHTALETQGFVW